MDYDGDMTPFMRLGQHLSAANRDVKPPWRQDRPADQGTTGVGGRIVTAVTDEHGRTELFMSEQMGTGSISL